MFLVNSFGMLPFYRLLRVLLDQLKAVTIYQHLLILAVGITINLILTQDRQE